MSIKKWKTLGQETIFEHPRLTLIEDTVELPTGKITKYLRYKRTGHVVRIIPVNKEGHILLMREYSHPPAEVFHQFPGGVVPNDEDVAVGANRELMEECGLSGNLELIGEYYHDYRRTDSKTYLFVATDLKEGHLPADEEEFIEYDWYNEQQVDMLIANGEVKDVFVLAAWATYKSWKSNARHASKTKDV